jgi:hypothetical protein
MKRWLIAFALVNVGVHAQALDALGAADCKPRPPVRYEHRVAPLTPQELAMARRAWKYFEGNTQPTGLANAVDHARSGR